MQSTAKNCVGHVQPVDTGQGPLIYVQSKTRGMNANKARYFLIVSIR